ncbi:MAG: hypothetical protein US68_C0017G0017 [Candidatus Shapirobacteria bacterium GW2011_GWE1_38_10]|uniref:GNAT family N-acetyltransferase n=1 Tax=Candidatus Shapirobacteria bacterium GW2011_GWE1_38_10 TaxID=1618488 RepID=A0A0G0L9B2_9BACT|nr:MAG: hypothetical protein US46_C0011G0004 [Candidatus Shapirobacteria bacterium GW2011_GWF2_37_20]KKQ49236.1 MAG: hypothetical protein US68_C0017G0017 [Candidatus Shapirobacteria bacterium GW2011_GWE1_38_10]KKQ62882.1 MAG: hypothetical protein US85_C0021G0011 [Candidatus Shapirobacteria bacterium GW2011_GWF1_38_23]HBP50800.1 GNAT family N-acetyltransferase [Candidatus Shapirobacteria bacterium]
MFKPFVPSDFEVPERLETDKFRLRMLKVTDVVKDYDAVMTSVDHLQGIFGPRSKWPTKDLTFEQDLIDLGWHQKEYQTRSSFAYTVMDLDESRCLGCMYIFHPTKEEFDAEVYMWVRENARDLDILLYETVRKWILEKWPFKRVAYPGRGISWDEWNRLK